MKRLRSTDDLDSFSEKNASKEVGNPSNRSSSSSHRGFYYNKTASDNGAAVRKGLISPRYERERSSFLAEDESSNREGSRGFLSRKRSGHDFEGFDRRNGFDHRFREEKIHRSESFCVSRRDFPKGFRSDRERPRREGSVSSSWRRFGSGVKDFGVEDRERGGGVRVRERERKDVKSPSWSRDSGSDQSRIRGGLGADLRDSRSKSKLRSSPSWSRDSGSEQSKSVGDVTKKNEEDPQVESKSSSEMEEGELEPEELSNQIGGGNERGIDAEDRAEIETEKQDGIGRDQRETEIQSGLKEAVNESKKINMENDKVSVKEVKVVNKIDNSTASENMDHSNRAGVSAEGDKECGEETGECGVEESKDDNTEDATNQEVEVNGEKNSDLEVKEEAIDLPQSNKEITEETGAAEMTINLMSQGSNHNIKDKGKSVVGICTLVTDSTEYGASADKTLRNILTCRDGNMDIDEEGPSTRGFELFSNSPVRKPDTAEPSDVEKQKNGRLMFESLDLSLSLPNVLLPIGGQDANQPPGSPSDSRNVHSMTNTFCTNSDGFTASMSFSGSQSLYHNPSCSLTQNSFDDYEQSVHSRPIFQGIDQVAGGSWQGQSQNDSRHKEVPLFQRILMNGNASVHKPQASHGISNGPPVQTQHARVLEGSSTIPNGLERQLSFHKQSDGRSSFQNIGSLEVGPTYSLEKKSGLRDRHSGSLHRSSSHKEQKHLLVGRADSVETVIAQIVSDPIHVMAKKLSEMNGQFTATIKESIREIMLNIDKRAQLYTYHNALLSRSDITLEMLLKAHRFQLEILVALKTSLTEFLQVENNISNSDLAEIFLNLRCRNLTCRSLLPVDECDCKVCSKKTGFCSSCMCLVCSKFDMASNTCSWVGCDVCLHWCHADCGLRESYIRNGNSASGPQGTTDMQFHCVACDHPSEMFGFVKEVFQNFAKEWTREAFSKELEYVRRIFSTSKDMRGRRLHEFANQLIGRLGNKSDLSDVYKQIMGFLAECSSSNFVNAPAPVSSRKEQAKHSNGVAGPSQDNNTSWLKSVYSDNSQQLGRSSSLFHNFSNEQPDKHPVELEFHQNSQKEPLFEELESIVKIKQAEAKMFQSRADDARREAEGLRRIAVSKNEKVDEEYMSRIAKLGLAEVEETRKKKLEELSALERAHREYFNMKMRMEEDIKDLLSKMETTKRNLAL